MQDYTPWVICTGDKHNELSIATKPSHRKTLK